MLVFVGVSDSDSGNLMHLPTRDWGELDGGEGLCWIGFGGVELCGDMLQNM